MIQVQLPVNYQLQLLYMCLWASVHLVAFTAAADLADVADDVAADSVPVAVSSPHAA